MRIAGTTSFNLRKLAAAAQREPDGDLAAALLLYAHENNQLDRLSKYLYDEDLAAEYAKVEVHLGARSIERLALRGTPMQSLPERYRAFLEAYEVAYHTPESVAQEKTQLHDTTCAALLRSGTTPAEIARALNLDPANLAAYLGRKDIHRFTLQTARQIAQFAGQ